MTTLVIVLIVIVSVLLILVILAQNPKGGGLASGFGGSSATQFMGVKKTGDFLESATWVLVVLLLSLSLMSTVIDSSSTEETESGSINVETAKDNKSTTSPSAIEDSVTEE